MYLTDIGSTPVISDKQANELSEAVRDSSSPLSGGYEDRDYKAHALGSYAPMFRGGKIPRSKWDDLMKMQDDNHSSPWHHHKNPKVPILDQNGLPYCWMYGVVAGVMNRYAFQGIPVPHLSATGPAAQGKNFRKQGGWGGEAVKYITKYGIPTMDTWPEHQLDRGLITHEMELDAARHKVVEFLELPANDFDMAVSVLLDPDYSFPVTLGLSWWGHLVCGLRAVKIDRNEYGILIVNSWKESWEDGGYAILKQSKATAHEYVAIKRVTPRMAA